METLVFPVMSRISEVKEVAELALIGAGLYVLYKGVSVDVFGRPIISVGGNPSNPQPQPNPAGSPNSSFEPFWVFPLFGPLGSFLWPGERRWGI